MAMERDDRRVEVRRVYGDLASTQGGMAGGPGCCAPSAAGDAESHGIVDEAGMADLGPRLGCGDPVALAQLRPGESVLDLGSGGGLDCFRAADEVGSSGRVVGVDMTPEMVSRARLNRDRLGVDNVEFRLGEIEYLPVADESVDVVISNCVLNLVPDRVRAFEEAYRVLRAGGRLAVCDVLVDKPLPDALLRGLPEGEAEIAGIAQEAEYLGALREAGFVEVQVDRDFIGAVEPEDAPSGAGVPSGATVQLMVQTAETGDTLAKLNLDPGVDLSTLPRSFNARITAVKPAGIRGLPAPANG